ncbi:MAG: serine/threonine protein kinase [Saprospiraceae bacterium]|nr:serine/threonine protein kinase [Saprospiraceae bacterium]
MEILTFNFIDMEQYLEGKVLGRFRLVRLLGKGGFGEVWEVNDENQKEYAIKIFNQVDHYNPGNTSPFEDEFYLIKNLVHPNLLIPLLMEKQNNIYYIVMPLCEKSLMEDLKERMIANSFKYQDKHQIYTEKELSIIMRDVADGLAYLKDVGIIHKDIKPDNILLQKVGSKYVYKISDFGISDKFAVSSLKVTKLLDTKTDGIAKAYAPPEYFQKKIDAKKSDVFSLAMSIYELATGDTPQGENGLAFGETLNILTKIPTMPEHLNYSRRFSLLLNSCLSLNPKHRPSAKEIAIWSDEFLNTGSWPNEMSKQLTLKVAPEEFSLQNSLSKSKPFNVKWIYAVVVIISLSIMTDYIISNINYKKAENYFSVGDNSNAKKFFLKAIPMLLPSSNIKGKIKNVSFLINNYDYNSRFYDEFSIAAREGQFTIINDKGEDQLSRKYDTIIPLKDNTFLLKYNSIPRDSIYFFKNAEYSLLSLKNNVTNEVSKVRSIDCNLVYNHRNEIHLRNYSNQIFTLIK